MRFPSKFISYKESTISKFPVILKPLQDCDFTVKELYRKTKASFLNMQEFVEALDCLFLLGKVILVEDVIHYVKEN